MLSFHLQPKLETKLPTHNWTKGKMIILLKYIENTRWRENYRKWSSKWIQGYQIRGALNTMGKSWLSDENNSDAQDCATWQDLISWNTSSINTTSTFWSNKMLSHHRSMPHQYFGPIASCHIIGQSCHIISQCHSFCY